MVSSQSGSVSFSWLHTGFLGSRWLNRPGPMLKVVLRCTDKLTATLPRRFPIPATADLYEGPASALLYHLNGLEHRGLLRSLSLLSPTTRILDIGCGLLRKGHALIPVVAAMGRYTGVEIRPEAVEWCRANWSHSGAVFHLVDVANAYYAPNNRGVSSALELPVPGQSADLVLLCSVFTHLQYPAMTNYLSELSRVLSSKGAAFITMFLIDPSGSLSGRKRQPVYEFGSRGDGCFINDPFCAEHVVAYNFGVFSAACVEASLEITGIYKGSWRGRKSEATYQDIVILRKASASRSSL